MDLFGPVVGLGLGVERFVVTIFPPADLPALASSATYLSTSSAACLSSSSDSDLSSFQLLVVDRSSPGAPRHIQIPQPTLRPHSAGLPRCYSGVTVSALFL